jgi:uncharacterized protein
VDVLFVDEAAQMSLANVLAVCQAADSLVLLGDPQQLEQPTKGSHPDGAGVSALAHLLDGRQTIEEDRGLFLEETRRLHPDVCEFTSEVFYQDKLRFEAFLVMRGVKTLPLRMRRHCSNARTVYEALKDHPAIERLLFPGDPSHPDAEAVKKLLPPGQAGGAIGIDVRGGEEGAYGFVDRLQLVATSASIGDLTTLALHPASATHRMLSAEARAALGITDGLVRLSIGAEDIDDILADLRQALEAA